MTPNTPSSAVRPSEGAPTARPDGPLALPPSRIIDRLGEWRGSFERVIRSRPVGALLVAVGAGIVVGRLFALLVRNVRERAGWTRLR
jgi:hypothetical protein